MRVTTTRCLPRKPAARPAVLPCRTRRTTVTMRATWAASDDDAPKRTATPIDATGKKDAVTVVVTLVVYWLAEQYAELLGAHTHDGRLPSARLIRSSLAEAWPMVTASFLPVASIGVAVLFGASSSNAAQAALIVTVVLLIMHGDSAGRAAGLRGKQRIIVTLIAGLLGVAMVILKSVLQHHHY